MSERLLQRKVDLYGQVYEYLTEKLREKDALILVLEGNLEAADQRIDQLKTQIKKLKGKRRAS